MITARQVFDVQCDGCRRCGGEIAGESLPGVAAALRQEGWTTVRVAGAWQLLCPDCGDDAAADPWQDGVRAHA